MEMPRGKALCRFQIDYALRTNAVLFIHYAMLTVNWTEPKKRALDDKKEGFLAHYHQESDLSSWWRDNYIGKIETNRYTNKVNFMDKISQMRVI
jgi:hypothetical protein